MTSSIGSIGASSMNRPDPKEFFKKIDSDSSGDISQSELQALSEKMKEMSGNTLDASAEAFSGYDSDGSGSLSDDELKAVMENSGFGPSRGMEGMPPPPPRPEQAVSSYSDNSGEDTLSSVVTTLKKLLEQLQSENESGTSTTTASAKADPKDFFKKVDTDASGGISKDELSTLAENLNKMTGQSITVDESTFASLDSDSDGSLNGDELKSFMDKSGFAPPPPPPGGMAMKPPSEDNQGEASSSMGGSSSGSVSTDDLIAQLQTLLEKLSKSYASKNLDSGESLLSITG